MQLNILSFLLLVNHLIYFSCGACKAGPGPPDLSSSPPAQPPTIIRSEYVITKAEIQAQICLKCGILIEKCNNRHAGGSTPYPH